MNEIIDLKRKIHLESIKLFCEKSFSPEVVGFSQIDLKKHTITDAFHLMSDKLIDMPEPPITVKEEKLDIGCTKIRTEMVVLTPELYNMLCGLAVEALAKRERDSK
jgi:hypothetical protein